MAADVDGKLIQGSTRDQATLICDNLAKILAKAGSSLEQVVRVTVRAHREGLETVGRC